MKNAQEWLKELRHESSYGEPLEDMKSRIKRIQLDAWKQGMTDACSIVEEHESTGILEIDKAILYERDITVDVSKIN